MCAKQSDLPVRAAGPKACPICGKPSYSLAGVHPQCSQRQADLKTSARLKEAAKKAAANGVRPKPAPTVRSWHKRCPECHKDVHVRLARCACGFAFVQ
jgi:endogenous inhibitor of DNA gyrase (YacG/DUF329 family)